MEVKMNKEIRDYQESMFMGLDLIVPDFFVHLSDAFRITI